VDRILGGRKILGRGEKAICNKKERQSQEKARINKRLNTIIHKERSSKKRSSYLRESGSTQLHWTSNTIATRLIELPPPPFSSDGNPASIGAEKGMGGVGQGAGVATKETRHINKQQDRTA
jgi:hypothetical protein